VLSVKIRKSLTTIFDLPYVPPISSNNSGGTKIKTLSSGLPKLIINNNSLGDWDSISGSGKVMMMMMIIIIIIILISFHSANSELRYKLMTVSCAVKVIIIISLVT
jgi:hypothetical protein